MKILVLSDSHGELKFMRQHICAVRPDYVVHLGDHYEDGEILAKENPGTPFYQVAGNCDRYRCPEGAPETICCSIGGVLLYMTHGHRQGVKLGLEALVAQARAKGAAAALYGHTHVPDRRQIGDLWIINPGSCRSFGGTACVIEIENRTIQSCRIITQNTLEDIV